MSILMRAVFNKNVKLTKELGILKLHCLWTERKMQDQQITIAGKIKRIRELYAEIDSLKRQNQELQHQIEIKKIIMNKQAKQLQEYMSAVHGIKF